MTGPVNIQTSTASGLDIQIEVNPNAYHGDENPDIYIARFCDANAVPAVDDEVTVVQPDDDPSEPEFVSTAVVTQVDTDHQLITMRVDWKGFHDVEPNQLPVMSPGLGTINYREAVLRMPA